MVDLAKLSAQGRAYSGTRPWTPEELDAVLLLEREGLLTRSQAADHVRNGVTTLEALAKATKAGFKPKTLEDAAVEAEAILKDNDFAVEEEVVTEEVAPVEEEVVKKGKK